MENQPLLHRCGLCNKLFESEELYTSHVCDVTKRVPTDAAHMGPEFRAVSEGALLRGATKKALLENGYTQEQAAALTATISSQEQADMIVRTFIKQ